MRKLIVLVCGLSLAAVSCYSISTPAPTALPGIVKTIVVQTAQAAATATALAAPPTATPVAACTDSAALVQETSAEDSLSVPSGTTFTTTWQLHNTGECRWHGYSVAFVSGDRLGSPDAIPVPDTAPKSTANLSIDLLAPTTAGSFTALFELRDASGKALQLGEGTTFPISVAVAELVTPSPTPTAEVFATPAGGFVLPVPPADCQYVRSGSYPGDVIALVNKARADAGLPALKVNPLLNKSAQAHSTDMACNNYLSHDGRDHSSIHDRVVAAGYAPKFSEEMIFCSGYPADAFKWWMDDPPHRDVILDKRVTEVGAGYAYIKQTQCGGYYTMDFGVP